MTRLMRIAGAVAIALCAMLGFLAFSSPTMAAPRCGTSCPSVSLSSRAPRSGAQVTLAGRGFAASHRIQIRMRSDGSQLGTAHTDAAGAFRASVILPQGLRGTDVLIAVDSRTGEQARELLRLGGAAGPATSGGYAGVALIGLAAIGFVLLTGSTLLLFTGRQQHASA